MDHLFNSAKGFRGTAISASHACEKNISVRNRREAIPIVGGIMALFFKEKKPSVHEGFHGHAFFRAEGVITQVTAGYHEDRKNSPISDYVKSVETVLQKGLQVPGIAHQYNRQWIFKLLQEISLYMRSISVQSIEAEPNINPLAEAMIAWNIAPNIPRKQNTKTVSLSCILFLTSVNGQAAQPAKKTAPRLVGKSPSIRLLSNTWSMTAKALTLRKGVRYVRSRPSDKNRQGIQTVHWKRGVVKYAKYCIYCKFLVFWLHTLGTRFVTGFESFRG